MRDFYGEGTDGTRIPHCYVGGINLLFASLSAGATSLLCVAAVMDLLWELVAGPKDCAEGNAYLGLKDIRFMQVNG